jgi:formylglycine-generating enzyme
MKKLSATAAALALMYLGVAAQANITIDTVTVGDPGNAADTAAHSGNPAGQGAVSYTYNIGKYEVTAGQYAAFLNAKAATDPYGLYNSKMWSDSYGCKIQRSGNSGSYTYSVSSDYANRPVNYVSYWDACRFANWLGNGQGTGSTETGAYTIPNGYNGIDGRTIQRNAGATWAVTSEDEWYKAAYYKGGGANTGYWLYPTQSDSINTAMANYNSSVGHTTAVGAYAYPSAYGTFGQGGNVWEWNEAILYQDANFASRGLRGGSFSYGGSGLQSSYRSCWNYPSYEVDSYYFGFRVSEVPEPSSIIALLGGLAGLLGIGRRKA